MPEIAPPTRLRGTGTHRGSEVPSTPDVVSVCSRAMARRDSYQAHLASVPLFAGCSARELAKIAKAGDEVRIAAGQVLTQQGDAGREAFVIVEGTATVKRGGRKVATLGPGDSVGELALLDHGPRTATVVADEDMVVFVLGAREFAAVLTEVPTLARKVMAVLAERIRVLDRQVFA